MKDFIRREPGDLVENPFTLIGDDWMLITSGTPGACNTMTASWGGLGIMWGKPVAFVFVRPVRYSHEFLAKNRSFSLSFFPAGYEKSLAYCGKVSGRDEDKIAACGFSVEPLASGAAGISQARLVLDCTTLSSQPIDPDGFLDAGIMKHYPNRDFHTMFIAEIRDAWIRE